MKEIIIDLQCDDGGTEFEGMRIEWGDNPGRVAVETAILEHVGHAAKVRITRYIKAEPASRSVF